MASHLDKSKDDKNFEDRKKRSHLSGCSLGQEVIPECEVIFENAEDNLSTRYKYCPKNPDHENFIPVTKFTLEDLPPANRNPQMMDEIFRRCALTVRIRATYTSLDRPDTFADSNNPYPYCKYKGSDRAVRYGTGSIVQAFYHHESLRVKSCPCHLCRTSGHPEKQYWWVRVRTATHVIHDRSEAEKAEFDCFFDTDDRVGVKTIYGFDTFNAITKSEKKYRNDVCDVLCVTHDWDTVNIISRINPIDNFLHPPSLDTGHAPSKVIVSHPHGCCKKITVGNILHLTVPIGEDYPVNSEIPFKKDTIYCKSLESGKSDSDSEPEDGKHKASNESQYNANTCTISSKDYNLKEKLDSVLKIPLNKETKKRKSSSSEDDDDDVETNIPVPREEYVVDFYFLFLREHCLKILLVCAILDQRNKQDCKAASLEHHILKQAFEETLRSFLGKQFDSTLNDDNDDPTMLEGKELTHHFQFLKLWKESDEEYTKFKSYTDTDTNTPSNNKVDKEPSIIVSWFAEVEKILDSVVSALKAEGKPIDEELLPTVIERGLKAGVKILMMRVQQMKDNESQFEYKSKSESQNKDEENKMTMMTKPEICNSNENGNDNDRKNNKEQEDQQEFEEYQNVPDGATFTLPPNAEYAFRVYNDNPGWISFPPGTFMTTVDGTREEIGHPLFEFKHPSIQPEQSYVTYTTNTCPGSSGAIVYCEMLGKYLGTYFPHSGYNKILGYNRSGIRDNFYTLFSKLLMFKPRNVLREGEKDMKNCDGEGKMKRETPSLIEGAKLLLLNMKEVLSK